MNASGGGFACQGLLKKKSGVVAAGHACECELGSVTQPAHVARATNFHLLTSAADAPKRKLLPALE